MWGGSGKVHGNCDLRGAEPGSPRWNGSGEREKRLCRARAAGWPRAACPIRGGTRRRSRRSPGGVGALVGVVQGLLVHADWAAACGSTRQLSARRRGGRCRSPSGSTTCFARNPRPLAARRPPGLRSPGTCRDFALLLAAFLRAPGESRRGCAAGSPHTSAPGGRTTGSASIGTRRPASGGLADAQADAKLRARSGTDFDPADVPRGHFLLAGEAWRGCRLGEADPEAFGHGSVTHCASSLPGGVRVYAALLNPPNRPQCAIAVLRSSKLELVGHASDRDGGVEFGE